MTATAIAATMRPAPVPNAKRKPSVSAARADVPAASALACLDNHADGSVFTDTCTGDAQQTWQ